MKRTISLLALLLGLALPLTGCVSMLERSYAGSETHVDYPVIEDDSTLRVETYQGLVNAILYYINEHSQVGSIRLYNYSGDVEEDLEQARAEAVEQDPLAAYAVRELTYDITRILTYYEVDVRITYAHSAKTITAIRPVSGQVGLRAELGQLIAERQSQTVLLLSYFSGDDALVRELFQLVRYSDPARYMDQELPALQVTFYPREGSRRVVELSVNWGAAGAEPEEYAQLLEAATGLLLMASPPVGENYTVEELAAIIQDNALYTEDGSDLALAALSGEPASELGLTLAMEYLCQRTGIEVTPVLGDDGRGPWLIVATPEGNRHLLPQGLIPVGEESPPEEVPTPLLYTDGALTALGYSWNTVLYPACVEPAPEPVPSEEVSTEPLAEPAQEEA